MEVIKEEQEVNAHIPASIIENANNLTDGQMIPVRTDLSIDSKNKPFLSFLIKESDELLAKLSKNPDVEISFGETKFSLGSNVFVLFLFLRLEDMDEYTYETAFSFSVENMYEDCMAFAQQDNIQIIMKSPSNIKVIKTQMNSVHQAMSTYIKSSSEFDDVDLSTFMTCVNFIQNQTESTPELYQLFKKANGLMEIVPNK